MVSLAIWLISATVVLVFVIFFLGMGLAFFSTDTGKASLWIIGLSIAGLIIYSNQQNNNYQEEQNAAAPSIQACINEASSKAMALKQQAIGNNTYTTNYSNQLKSALDLTISRCRTASYNG